MKLLLDMGLAPRTADFLRSQGHDADHLRWRGLSQLADREVMALAAAEDRIAVTFDLDFSRILAIYRLVRPSVILFRLDRFTTDELNATLISLLQTHSSELTAGAIVVVDPATNSRAIASQLVMWLCLFMKFNRESLQCNSQPTPPGTMRTAYRS